MKSAKTISTFQFMELFPNEVSAVAFIEKQVWGDQTICPHCNSKGNSTPRPKRHGHRCNPCRKDFTVRIGTIEAAQELKRNWIGIDISGNAVDEIKSRIGTRGINHSGYSKEYNLIEGNPETMSEYGRLNAYERQDWLIRRLDGLPNSKKSGDGGVDGDMSIYLDLDNKGKDKWSKLIFSVKAGKQKKPADLRELKGTMQAENADIGILILDIDPTPNMEQSAEKAGKIKLS